MHLQRHLVSNKLKAILTRVELFSKKGILISIDVDQEALNVCKNSLNDDSKKIYIKKNSYSDLPEILKKMLITAKAAKMLSRLF